MEHMHSIDVKRFIVNTHHCAEKYAEAFPEGNCKVFRSRSGMSGFARYGWRHQKH